MVAAGKGEGGPAKRARKQQADYDDWKLLVLQKALAGGGGGLNGAEGAAGDSAAGETVVRGPMVARMKQSKLW